MVRTRQGVRGAVFAPTVGVSLHISTGGATHVGMLRTNNEDCYRIVPSLNLYVLADGMGGEAHGEVASALAVETVVKHCMDGQDNPALPFAGDSNPALAPKTRRLLSAVHLANQKVFASAEEHPEQQGMGATLTAAWIDSSRLSIA